MSKYNLDEMDGAFLAATGIRLEWKKKGCRTAKWAYAGHRRYEKRPAECRALKGDRAIDGGLEIQS